MKICALFVILVLATPSFAQKTTDFLQAGRDITNLFYDGKADDIWERFSPQMKSLFGNSDALLGWHLQMAGQYGVETAVIDERVTPLSELVLYQREVIFQKNPTPMMLEWMFDSNGVITGFLVRPAVAGESHLLRYKDTVELRLPFKGNWLVLSGGRSLIENQHAVSTDQRFAYDLTVIKHGKTFSGDGSRPEQHFCFGHPILAPAAGKVVEAKDGIPDNMINAPFASPPEGNHVIIDHGNSEYSVLAHLKLGSVKVKAGETVKSGQKIGKCGNSGNSPTPHLHVHLQNTPVLFKAEGLPMQFVNYVADKKLVASGEPERGQIIRANNKN